MVNKVLKFVKENEILKYGDSVILGVSGGADSICMLYVLNELKPVLNLTLNVVHVNHHIRGEEAQRDADFVKDICERLEIGFNQIDADIPKEVEMTGMSEEEAGRKARYEAFSIEAAEKGANKIAVAHNLNDNSETILFNLFRGTGIKGLTGIPIRREMIVRPLICCTRQEIEDYLKSVGIAFCTDETNNTTEYSRNKIRIDVLPYIKDNINEKAEYNIVNAAENLSEIYDFLNKEAKKAYDVYVKGNIFINEGFKLHSALQNEIVRHMIYNQVGKLKDITKTHIKSVVSLSNMSVSKSISLPYGLTAVRVYDGIQIKKDEENHNYKTISETLIKDGEFYSSNKIEITMETEGFNIENIKELVYTKWFDCDKIHALALRNRQKGDYIVINNNGGRKKLKDYFIDEKVPKEERDNILLLADGSHVVWVIGYRISSFYKVTNDTTHVIKVTYKI